MPTEVILPRVDMDMATGKIARWYVAEGEAVEKGTPIFEIETDKAAMEIEAPVSGIIRDLADPTGQDLPVGMRVAWIYGTAEDFPSAAPSEAPIEAPEAEPQETNGRRATPLARRLARARGIDLASLRGSGPHGRIQSRDIRPRIDDRGLEPADALTAAWPSPDPTSPQDPDPPKPEPVLHHVWLRPGEGRPIVMLHGFGADLNAWRILLSGLDLGRPILGLDLPGHGRSPLGDDFSFEGLVARVETTLRRLDIESLDLAGHSLGGAIATAVAARGAVECRSLLLIASAGLGPAINGDFLGGFLRATSAASLAPWLRLLVGTEADLPAALVTATLLCRAGGMIGPAQARLAAALFPDGTQAFSTRTMFDRLVMPVKLIFGIDDRIVPARHVQGLPGTVALHLFAGVGHMPQIERRIETLRLWTELLRSAT